MTTVTGTISFTPPAPATAAQVAAALAATPSFVAAVAAALSTPVVTPPVTTPPVSGTAPVLKVVFAQNGQTPLLPTEYDYSATDAHADTVDGGDGNPACIKVTVTGPWGGFQPSNLNNAVTDFSACSTLVVSVKSPAAGLPYSMQFLMGGDLPITDAAGNQTSFNFTSTKANVWERFSCAKALLMTDAKAGDVSAKIYKGAIQSHSGTTGTFLLDNWGGS